MAEAASLELNESKRIPVALLCQAWSYNGQGGTSKTMAPAVGRHQIDWCVIGLPDINLRAEQSNTMLSDAAQKSQHMADEDT